MARGAELAGIALRAEDAEEIFEGVAEALRVVVAKFVDDLKKTLERLWVAIRQVSVFENIAKERRDAWVFGHLGNAFTVKAEHLVTAERWIHEFCPAVTGVVAGEELALAAKLFAFCVHVVHEFVDQRDGDLLDLGFGVRNFANKNVASGVDAAFGVGVEHGLKGELVE